MQASDIKKGQTITVKLTAYLDSEFVSEVTGKVFSIVADGFILKNDEDNQRYVFKFDETTLF